jgi:hypothetical protein
VLLAAVVLRRHQLSIPAKNCVRRRKGRHFLQRLPAERLAQLRQAAPFPVRQSEPVLAKPLQQRRVLRPLVLNHPHLLLSQIPIHAARNCRVRGSNFSAFAVFAVSPIRPFYAP